MSYCWLVPAEHPPAGAVAWAPLSTVDARGAGGLAALPPDAPAPATAVKIDARAVDANGPPGYVSLVEAPPGTWLLFDDVAVTGAIRRALAGPPYDVVSALSQRDDRFLGALTGLHGEAPSARLRLADDPFALLFPRRLLRIGAGFLGRTPAPVGPSMQRYGAGSPWPWDRFPGSAAGRR